MSPTAQSVVIEAMTSFQHNELPPILQSRLDQHKKNLTNLAGALLAGGQNADQVRHTIEEVLESFKGELFRTIELLREDADAL